MPKRVDHGEREWIMAHGGGEERGVDIKRIFILTAELRQPNVELVTVISAAAKNPFV